MYTRGTHAQRCNRTGYQNYTFYYNSSPITTNVNDEDESIKHFPPPGMLRHFVYFLSAKINYQMYLFLTTTVVSLFFANVENKFTDKSVQNNRVISVSVEIARSSVLSRPCNIGNAS